MTGGRGLGRDKPRGEKLQMKPWLESARTLQLKITLGSGASLSLIFAVVAGFIAARSKHPVWWWVLTAALALGGIGCLLSYIRTEDRAPSPGGERG